MTNREILWMSALLHDIGKFWERTNDPEAASRARAYPAQYSHEPFSALFVDTFYRIFPDEETRNHIRLNVQNHHRVNLPDEICLAVADQLSSGERLQKEVDDGGTGRFTTPVFSVFSTLRVEEGGRLLEAERKLKRSVKVLSFDKATLFGSEDAQASQEEYRKLWDAFTREIARVGEMDGRTLFALLKKYTSFVPSDTRYQSRPDVSLFDHLKTTAAIAYCLGGWDTEEVAQLRQALPRRDGESEILRKPIAQLVKGDISGTQDFLYLLTSSGAARGLRGRSFYLQLLCETVAHWILRRLNVPVTNLLFAGGGHFYLLLPHDLIGEMETIRRQVSEKLWQIHRGDLSMNIDGVTVCAEDFTSTTHGEKEDSIGSFSARWEDVSKVVGRKKTRKWRDLDDSDFHLLFTPQGSGGTKEVCQICQFEGRVESEREDGEMIRKCRRCSGFEDLGREIRTPERIVEYIVPESIPDPQVVDPNWQEALELFGVRLEIKGDLESPLRPAAHAESAVVYRVDSTEFMGETSLRIPSSFDFRILGGATPVASDGEIARFGDIAKASEGAEWIGVLRMDVDNLGRIFRHGLGKRATVSRMTALSEELRWFFEAHVPRICEEFNQTQEGMVYLIYAGGDDLFIVGSWNLLPEIAIRIRRDFREYVGGDHVTISGGIAIEHAKYPLYRLADQAKIALDDNAKEYKRGDRSKDALCFLGHTAGWKQWDEIKEWKDSLKEMIEKDRSSRAIISRLNQIYHMYDQIRSEKMKLAKTGKVDKTRLDELVAFDKWQWHAVYSLSRFGRQHGEIAEEIGKLQQRIAGGFIEHVGALARWVELLTRKGGSEDE